MSVPAGATLSEDGHYWWDGSDWQPVDGQPQASYDPNTLADGQLSDDGHYRWDGSDWQPVDGAGSGAESGGGQSGEVNHPVVHIAQQSQATCWAASIAMIINYRDGTTFDDHTLCDHLGMSKDGATVAEIDSALAQVDMHLVAPSCYTPDGWLQLLEDGPKGVIVPGAPWHRIVIAGAKTDGTAEGTTLHVLDPAGGEDWQKYDVVETKYEAGAPRENNIFGY